jgi:hypothetical protein
MKNLIKFILKEEEENFDWVRDAQQRIEIGKPIDFPKNKFKFVINYMHGDADGYTDNVIMVDGGNLELVDKYVTVLEALDGSREPYDAIDKLIEQGIRPWDLDEYWNDPRFDVERKEAENDKEKLRDWFSDSFSEGNFIEHDMHYDGYARMIEFTATYFNHQGLEHRVKINKL